MGVFPCIRRLGLPWDMNSRPLPLPPKCWGCSVVYKCYCSTHKKLPTRLRYGRQANSQPVMASCMEHKYDITSTTHFSHGQLFPTHVTSSLADHVPNCKGSAHSQEVMTSLSNAYKLFKLILLNLQNLLFLLSQYTSIPTFSAHIYIGKTSGRARAKWVPTAVETLRTMRTKVELCCVLPKLSIFKI